jgi:hypothetical protein
MIAMDSEQLLRSRFTARSTRSAIEFPARIAAALKPGCIRESRSVELRRSTDGIEERDLASDHRSSMKEPR